MANGTRPILITGAAGKTGRAVLSALVQRQEPVRCLVRSRSQQAALERLGAAEVVVGDLLDRSAVAAAFESARAVYHICPNMLEAEVAAGQLAIEAARRAGTEHFVYHSVLHPQTEDMPHHWTKLRVEEGLLASGLPFTILQPSPYMQNLTAQLSDVVATGSYRAPYGAQQRTSLVDLADVGEAAATVLTDGGHIGATYELCSRDLMSQKEVADAVGEHLGRPVEFSLVPVEAWARGAAEAGMTAYAVETFTKMFRYLDLYGLRGNANVLEWLLRREAGTFRAFLQRHFSAEPGAH